MCGADFVFKQSIHAQNVCNIHCQQCQMSEFAISSWPYDRAFYNLLFFHVFYRTGYRTCPVFLVPCFREWVRSFYAHFTASISNKNCKVHKNQTKEKLTMNYELWLQSRSSISYSISLQLRRGRRPKSKFVMKSRKASLVPRLEAGFSGTYTAMRAQLVLCRRLQKVTNCCSLNPILCTPKYTHNDATWSL